LKVPKLTELSKTDKLLDLKLNLVVHLLKELAAKAQTKRRSVS
jgi:hypothetical protein